MESILQWGGTIDSVDVYLANPKVAYSTAEGDWKQKIGTQKWIALYNRGVEGWAEWRRLDFPILNVAMEAETSSPFRMTYPSSEFLLNSESVNAAVDSKGAGKDDVWTRIFWDVH